MIGRKNLQTKIMNYWWIMNSTPWTMLLMSLVLQTSDISALVTQTIYLFIHKQIRTPYRDSYEDSHLINK